MVVLLLLVFEALPVEAEPPLVLVLTVALPELAVWLLLLVTLKSLSLLTVNELVLVALALFVENGPVVSMLAEGSELLKKPPRPPPVPLLTDTLVSELLLLLASPVLAPPALVLVVTLALPELARCILPFVTDRSLSFLILAVLLLLALTLFFEYG